MYRFGEELFMMAYDGTELILTVKDRIDLFLSTYVVLLAEDEPEESVMIFKAEIVDGEEEFCAEENELALQQVLKGYAYRQSPLSGPTCGD